MKEKNNVFDGQGNRLRELRCQNLYTQQQIADSLSIGLKQYQRYENGDCGIPPEKMYVLKTEYRFDMNYLIAAEKKDFDIDNYMTSLSYSDKCSFFKRMMQYWERLLEHSGKLMSKVQDIY